ncbi:MAG: helix-turn-helix transcriptional regulator [Clostridiales bacterium]|nr:helix-turn-helix transcriptional regulator [Clostridiales bacterium]
MNYGSKIAELRKSINLTQAELGAKLNVTAQAVSKWENGLSEPDIDSIKKLCELFSVSVDQFLDFSKKDSEDETATTDSSAPAHAQTLVIHGYCEKCNKPVGPSEYAVTNLSFNPSNKNKTVTNDPTRQHVFCKECHKQIVETKKTEEKNALLLKLAKETAEKKHNFLRA